jgi:hypothetical protein
MNPDWVAAQCSLLSYTGLNWAVNSDYFWREKGAFSVHII